MSAHFQRAELLFEQDRFDQAVGELQIHLGQDPNDAYAHSLMAISLANLGKTKEALTHAQEAMSLAPDWPYSYVALAQAELARKRYEAAAAATEKAIECAPFIAAYHGLLATIRSLQRRWPDVLQSANQGLEHDPEDTTCLNMRALALRQLSDNAAAAETVRGTLARNPEDPFAHANEGWGLLEDGNARQALVHFREALRLQPDMEYARLGILEALKAQNDFYRLLLQYLLWMGKKSATTQWSLAAAICAAVWVGGALARQSPLLALMNWLLITAILINSCAMLFARPLANAFLLFHPLGRLAITRDQTVQGLMTAVLSVGIATLYVWSHVVAGHHWHEDAWITLLLISIPALSIHDCQRGWPRWTVIGLLFLTPVIFFLPVLLAGVSPVWMQSWIPTKGTSNFVFIIALAIGLYLSCDALEDVELVE
jgi:Flp pilus assembly protein TadD